MMTEPKWYEWPIEVEMSRDVWNGENGERRYPERHYWPDLDAQREALNAPTPA